MLIHRFLAILVKHLIGMFNTIPDHQHGTDALVVTDQCLYSLEIEIELSHHVLWKHHHKKENDKPLGW
jgi:hypothetical protein